MSDLTLYASTTTDTRAEYTAGLRALADLLDANPDVPLPYGAGTGDSPADRLTFYFLSSTQDPKTNLARIARLIPGKVTKESDDYNFTIAGRLRGVHVQAVATRADVCERVVTGTRAVTHTTPAIEAAPASTITTVVEDVEWICAPILAAEVAS